MLRAALWLALILAGSAPAAAACTPLGGFAIGKSGIGNDSCGSAASAPSSHSNGCPAGMIATGMRDKNGTMLCVKAKH